MISLPEEKILYSEIQKKLFYIIPEKWESIHLYASVIDVPGQKPVGEMYFYYLPKGIIRKKFVNGYEIPSIFNIDEEQYSKLVTDIYNLIKLLRERSIKTKNKSWSNMTITIQNCLFKVEFDYENLKESRFDSYERHVIWRYLNLKEAIELFSRKEKKIIDAYENYMKTNPSIKRDCYTEGIYKQPVKNIIDFEKTLTVEEAIAQSKNDSEKQKEKKKTGLFRKNKVDDIIDEDDDDVTYNNQILNWKK